MASDALKQGVHKVVDHAARRFAAVGIESAILDAQVLMAEAAGTTREAVVMESIELTPAAKDKFEAMVARREKREPVAYIVGHKEFYSLEFEVSPAVLIPRPESEFVVRTTLEFAANKPHARVLDIGTGSGQIAIAIAVNLPKVRVVATDVSTEALEVASRNARRHRVDDRVTIRRADCFDPLDSGARLGSFDVIVSNPPYLDDTEIATLEPDVRGYEPELALCAGTGGLDILKRIATGAPAHLVAGGELIVEVATGQADTVASLVADAGLRVVGVINDFAGHPRVVRARKL